MRLSWGRQRIDKLNIVIPTSRVGTVESSWLGLAGWRAVGGIATRVRRIAGSAVR